MYTGKGVYTWPEKLFTVSKFYQMQVKAAYIPGTGLFHKGLVEGEHLLQR